MDDINILQDNSLQTIDLNLDAYDSTPIGIELLVDTKKINTSKDENKTPKEDINFFNDDDVPEKFNMVDNLSNDNLSNDNSYSTKSIGITNDPILQSENSGQDSNNNEYRPIHMMSAQDIKNEKIDLIYKFKKLENQGIRTTMNYNMNSQLDDMRNEYIKLKKQRESENAIKFQRKMLMACITGVEFLNGKFDPFSVKLDGWSESMNENVNDYDEVFEELHEKYGGGTDMAPELRLMFMVGGSAFMFHLTNTMFKSSLPGMDDIMKQNPELMQQFANAAVNSKRSEPQSQPQSQPQPQSQNPMGDIMGNMMGGMMGNMMGGMATQPHKTTQPKPQMDGAKNIDNIINNMNIDPDNIDIDSISIISSDSLNDVGITLDL